MLAWQEIETVLLDMDGTLIDLHFDNYFWQQLVPERWGQARGIPLDEARVTTAQVCRRGRDAGVVLPGVLERAVATGHSGHETGDRAQGALAARCPPLS